MVSETPSVLNAVAEVARKAESFETKGSAEVDAAEVHVLAVDDSLIDRKVIEKLLKNSAYKVTTVDSGRRALEILGIAESVGSGGMNVSSDSCSPSRELNIFNHAYEINLIITDYCMPGMTGYDLLKRVKESTSLKEIPVVLMSSENVPGRISRCLEEGAEDFLLKPVQLADVKRLRGHVRLPSVGNIYTGQPEVACSKRKSPPEGHQGQNPERRPRLSTVAVL